MKTRQGQPGKQSAGIVTLPLKINNNPCHILHIWSFKHLVPRHGGLQPVWNSVLNMWQTQSYKLGTSPQNPSMYKFPRPYLFVYQSPCELVINFSHQLCSNIHFCASRVKNLSPGTKCLLIPEKRSRQSTKASVVPCLLRYVLSKFMTFIIWFIFPDYQSLWDQDHSNLQQKTYEFENNNI